MPKLFLSHSHKDKQFVERVATDLCQNGIEVWYDSWDLDIGHELTIKIQEGLATSDYVAIVLSPAAVESVWVRNEWSTMLNQELDQRKVIILPIFYQECSLPLLLQGKVYIDFRNLADYHAQLQNLLRFLRGYTKGPDRTHVVSNCETDISRECEIIVKNIPQFRNLNFIGREQLLCELHPVQSGKAQYPITRALVGIGGIGKTQLAAEYAYRYFDDYTLIWWMRAEEPATLAMDYCSLAGTQASKRR